MSDKAESPPRVRPARPKYQVFVSSTFSDLHEERSAVTWEILKANHIPVGMEDFPATDDRGWRIIQRTIEHSDYYVLLIAGRYGSINPDTGKSWTQTEYEYAKGRGLKVLAFIRHSSAVTADKMDDPEKAAKLKDFISLIQKDHLVKWWHQKDDLRAEVASAIRNAIEEDDNDGTLPPGWYRGGAAAPPEVLAELARLSAENRKLLEDMGAAQKRAETAIIPYISQPEVTGEEDGMPTIHCLVENHGETPFRIVDEQATWWFAYGSVEPRAAKLKIRQRFAKPGETCDVRVLVPLSPVERTEYLSRVKADQYTSPLEAELVITCENAAGTRKIERKGVRMYVPRRP